MKLEMSPYLAGVATAALAIAAGFGGGVIVATSVGTDGAVPAPGMSRIERVRREEPRFPQQAHKEAKPEEARPVVAVETNAQAPRAEEPAINPLAEAQPLNVKASAPAAAANPQPLQLLPLQSEHQLNEAVLPSAIQTISSPREGRREQRRARTAERPARNIMRRQRSIPREEEGDPREVAGYPQREQGDDNRHQADVRSQDNVRQGNTRQDTRQGNVRQGNIRYVVRTENGRPANAAEVEQLKRELRARREDGDAEIRSLSYAPSYPPERRGVFPHIFGD